MFKKIAITLMLLLLLFIVLPLSVSSSGLEDVDDTHWAADEIQYVIDQNIASGYPDQTFRPNEKVTRGQTAKMLVKALQLELSSAPDPAFEDVDKNDSLYPYVAVLANEGIMNGNGETFRPNEKLSRAQMAVVLSNAFSFPESVEISFSDVSEDYWAYPSIARLVGSRITSGYTDGSFGPGDTTTRAHFAVFLARSLHEAFRVDEVNTPSSDVNSEKKAWHFQGIAVGDAVDKVTSTLGEPEAIEESRYGFNWHIYHDDYNNYVQFGIQHQKVVAVYSNQDTWKGNSGVQFDKTKEDVLAAYGEPLHSIQKGKASFHIETETACTYKQGDSYLTFFYDVHRDHRITAVLMIDQDVEEDFQQYYANPDKELKESYERQVFYLANAQRERFQRGSLTWDDIAAGTARAHSADMAGNHYFDHTNVDGESPFDRMSSDGIVFYNAAENIAYGQVSPIYAHQGWMNSKGHRDALLGNYTNLGVGVAFDEIRKQPYYTQNFYTPR